MPANAEHFAFLEPSLLRIRSLSDKLLLHTILVMDLIRAFLRPFRVALGYSQAEAANRADVSEGQWFRWDNGENQPREDSYAKIAKGLEYADWKDCFRDLLRFAYEHQEFIDTPWSEEMPKPAFKRQYGKIGVQPEEFIGSPPRKSFYAFTETPLSVVVDRLAPLNLDLIPTRSKREVFMERLRSLLERATVLDRDVQTFRSEVIAKERPLRSDEP